MKQCREHNCPLQDICRGAVDNETWWNIIEDCEIFAFVNAQADKIFELENRLKECENGYEGTLFLDRCKLHDAEEKVKQLTEENERLHASCTELTQECKKWQGRLKIECEYTKADTVRKMQEMLKKCFNNEMEHAAIYTEGQVLFAIDQIAKEMVEGAE